MSVVDRQRRREDRAPALAGNTPHGRTVVADRGTPPPLVDRPIPGGPNAPMPEGLATAFDEAANRPPPLPVIRDARTAYALAQKLQTQKENLSPEQYQRGVNALRVFQTDYPGAIDAYKQELVQTRWMDENLDSTPHKSSRLTAAQRKATALRHRAEGPEPTFASMAAARDIPIPKTLKDLPPLEPGSRAAVLEREEANGLDTTSGITSFAEQFNLARKVNGSNAQMSMMYALAKDNLEQAGVALPNGLDPINYNEDLGQLEALVPTEDGKVRRVLVDPEFFRAEDIGSVADVEELMAMVGATLSQLPGAGTSAKVVNKLAQRHPALAEFVGDFGWRNTGIVLEGLLDAEALGGSTSLQDVVEALDKSNNFGESATGTVFSRVLGRVIGGNGKQPSDVDINIEQFRLRGDTDAVAAERAQEAVQKNIQESADTLEEVQKLTDVPFVVTKADASGSLEEIAVQSGREARLTPKEQTALEIRQQRNRESLRSAVDNVHNNALPTNPSANPDLTSARLAEDIVAPAQKAQDINLSVSTFADDTGAVDLYNWRFNQGSGKVSSSGFGKRGEAGFSDIVDANSGATVRVDHGRKEVTIEWIGEDEKLQGGAAFLMERMMRDLSDIPADYRFVSDNQLSQYSMAMVKELEKAGFGVKIADGTHTTVDGDITWTHGPAREPVYEITHIPGRMMRVPLVADTVEYQSSRMADVLDDDLAFVDKANAHADFWGVKWQSQIGWQPQRQKSIYSVANPRSTKPGALRNVAQRLEARIERSLTGMEANEADRLLGQMFKKQVDEDGYAILSGLYDDTLDLGQLGRTRDSLRALYERTSDPEVGIVLDTVDDLMSNGKLLDNFGNPVAANIDQSVRGTWDQLDSATRSLRNAESAVVSNPLFKKNTDGEFINTDLKTLGNLLQNGSKFMQHLKPWMRGNPRANGEVQSALMDLYRDRVLSGTGFTAGKHHTFLRNYRVALEEVFSPEDLAAFRSTNFADTGKNILEERAARARSVMNRLERYGPLRAGNIVNDLTAIGKTGNPRARTRMYMKEIDRMNPQLGQQIRADSLEETRRMINDKFFSETASQNPLNSAKQYKEWLDSNSDALRALHGDQYVTDLMSTWRGLHLDTQRFRISAQTPALQGDVVRTSRTLMGPLNVWQRRVSASNWIRLRWHAKKALDAMGDPEKLRALNSAAGVTIRSRPGIAALVRSGILPGTGWDGKGEMPSDVYEKGLEFADWLESVDEELQSEKVEQEK